MIEGGKYPKKKLFKEDIILNNMIGKSFWCIEPNIIRVSKRLLGPVKPYRGKLHKGPGVGNWNLEPYVFEKTTGLWTVILSPDELFLDRVLAVEAYVESQIAYIKKLEEELKREEETLLNFILTEAK